MTHILKLSLALLLGGVAAATNWFYMTLQSQPGEYVAINTTLTKGAKIEEEDLTSVPIPGEPSRLRRSLIPYASRSILLGRQATRDYLKGDLVFSRDLATHPASSKWEVIGPFELISVGERFKETKGRQPELGSTRGDTVTIAVDAHFDEKTSRLLSMIAGDTLGGRPSEIQQKIVAVQVVPPMSPPLGAVSSSLDASQAGRPSGDRFAPNSFGSTSPANRVYQTVSLQGIASVPGVLLEGDFIRFVVPSSSL